MADTKISGLTARTTLAATDEFPAIAGGVNYRVPISALATAPVTATGGSTARTLAEWIGGPLEWAADIDSTIAVGGTAQQAVAASAARARLVVSVPLSAADVLYTGLGVAAVVGVGDPIGPGQTYDSGYPSAAADKLAVSVISATTGVAYKIRQKVFP